MFFRSVAGMGFRFSVVPSSPFLGDVIGNLGRIFSLNLDLIRWVSVQHSALSVFGWEVHLSGHVDGRGNSWWRANAPILGGFRTSYDLFLRWMRVLVMHKLCSQHSERSLKPLLLMFPRSGRSKTPQLQIWSNPGIKVTKKNFIIG